MLLSLLFQFAHAEVPAADRDEDGLPDTEDPCPTDPANAVVDGRCIDGARVQVPARVQTSTITGMGIAPTVADNFGQETEIHHEVNFRGRYLFIPKSILDIWYEDHVDDGSGFPARPDLSATTLGIEYVLSNGKDNGVFYAEWLRPNFEAGYWDDRESPQINDDGSWISPEKFGLVVIGADYQAELKASDWFSFTVGAGLGVGFRTGELLEWRPGDPEGGCGAGESAVMRAEHCEADGPLEIPGALPFLDFNVGPKFRFGDKAALRLEGGLHNMPYLGGSFGATF